MVAPTLSDLRAAIRVSQLYGFVRIFFQVASKACKQFCSWLFELISSRKGTRMSASPSWRHRKDSGNRINTKVDWSNSSFRMLCRFSVWIKRQLLCWLQHYLQPTTYQGTSFLVQLHVSSLESIQCHHQQLQYWVVLQAVVLVFQV